MAEQLKEKLRKSSIIIDRIGKPIILYRNTLEESADVIEEEVALLNSRRVVIQVFVNGGYLPINFRKLQIFPLDGFTSWLLE